MRTKPRKRTILLALTSTHHGFYRGAARYAVEHDWHVVADMIYDATILVGWKGDGILSFVGHWEDLAKYVLFPARLTRPLCPLQDLPILLSRLDSALSLQERQRVLQ